MDAKDRLTGADIQIVMPDGTKLADGIADLTDGSVANALVVNAAGGLNSGNAWTGTSSDGTKAANTCSDWTSTSGAGHAGDAIRTDAGWTDYVDDPCANAGALYCFETFDPVCGNGELEVLEGCDDGNTVDGDCCSSTCQVEAGGSICDDGNLCTQDSCDPVSGCQNLGAPASGCSTGWDKASLLIKENKPGKEAVKALMKRGPALAQADFGNPLDPGGTSYSLCIFDDADNLVGQLDVDRAGDTCDGKPCWADKNGKGWQYKDKLAESDGVGQIKYKNGDAGKTLVQMKAGNNSKKGQLALPLPIASGLQGSTSAKLQIVTSDAQCFEVEMTEIKKQEADFFKAIKK